MFWNFANYLNFGHISIAILTNYVVIFPMMYIAVSMYKPAIKENTPFL